MKKNIKKRFICGLAYFTVILMLPYTITAFWHGNAKGEAVSEGGRTVIISESSGIEEIPMDDYIAGVVAGQIDMSYEEEAIKAQTILTRSYICNIMGDEKSIDSKELKLEYHAEKELEAAWGESFKEYYDKVCSAVRNTGMSIMTYDGCVAEGVFHKISAGATRDGSSVYPYLVSVSSPKDIEAENYTSIKEYSFDEFVSKASGLEEGAVFSDGEAISLQVVETDTAGYVKSAMIGTKTFEGERIMEVFELPSCAFTFQILDNKVRIICKGSGYGYGMSQYGASRLAEEGSNAENILKYYFKGVEIGSWN